MSNDFKARYREFRKELTLPDYRVFVFDSNLCQPSYESTYRTADSKNVKNLILFSTTDF